MQKREERGFTLIELLVVIAIIGILSSIVLASLNTARNKGKDASAKASLSSLRASAEIYYSGNSNYGTAGAGTVTSAGVASGLQGACVDAATADGAGQKLLVAVAAQSGQTANCTIGLSGASYEADVTLNDTTIFCVDSNAFAGKPSATPIRAITGAVKCQ